MGGTGGGAAWCWGVGRCGVAVEEGGGAGVPVRVRAVVGGEANGWCAACVVRVRSGVFQRYMVAYV